MYSRKHTQGLLLGMNVWQFCSTVMSPYWSKCIHFLRLHMKLPLKLNIPCNMRPLQEKNSLPIMATHNLVSCVKWSQNYFTTKHQRHTSFEIAIQELTRVWNMSSAFFTTKLFPPCQCTKAEYWRHCRFRRQLLCTWRHHAPCVEVELRVTIFVIVNVSFQIFTRHGGTISTM